MLSFGEKKKLQFLVKISSKLAGARIETKKQGATLSSSCGRLLLFLSGVKTFKVTDC